MLTFIGKESPEILCPTIVLPGTGGIRRKFFSSYPIDDTAAVYETERLHIIQLLEKRSVDFPLL